MKIVIPGAVTLELALGARPLVEKLAHVGDQIPDHRQVSQGLYSQPIVVRNLVDVGPAGPARHAIHGHGARTAHADPAGIAVGERRIQRALDVGYDVEDGLARLAGNVELAEAAVRCAFPDPDLQPYSFKRFRRAASGRTPGGQALRRRSAGHWRCGTCTREACPPPGPDSVLFSIDQRHRRRCAPTWSAPCAGSRTA